MINFFRKIRYDLMEKNKTGKYLKYAIGEIILVVIGILIALQINNWNTNRFKEKTLKGDLLFVLEDIESDNIQLIELIKDRESSIQLSTEIIDSYKQSKTISSHKFLSGFNSIIAEKKFENHQDGFERIKTSEIFESNKLMQIRKLVRSYRKGIEDIEFRESKQNSSIEAMELELFRNGFYDKAWTNFRAYAQPTKFTASMLDYDFLSDMNEYGDVIGILLRNEWVMPFLIKNYKDQISIGNQLKEEIENYLNKK